MKVAVFGATGMLGRAVTRHLLSSGMDVTTVGRSGCSIKFVVGETELEDIELNEVEYIVNCMGLISHLINENDPTANLRAASINSLFPHELATYALKRQIKVIQIATDCVFSGDLGSYVESSIHDAQDTYGKSKSIGEVTAANVMNLRASIIGKEDRGFRSLLEWVLRQPYNAQLTGYTDRLWNGITTHAFARIVQGILENNLFRAGIQHVVPADSVSKADLIRQIAVNFDRLDIQIKDLNSNSPKNMTLETIDQGFNQLLWGSAGYSAPPTINSMVSEIAQLEGNL
jgi:dTDP-4-dehydrorhamnose reductase